MAHDHAHSQPHAHGQPHAHAGHEVPDAWHTHVEGEHMQAAHAENIQPGPVLVVGVGGFLIVVVTVVATVVFFNWTATSLSTARTENLEINQVGASKRLAAGQEFATYGVGDAQADLYRIPLAEARKKVLAAYAQRPSAPAASAPTPPAPR